MFLNAGFLSLLLGHHDQASLVNLGFVFDEAHAQLHNYTPLRRTIIAGKIWFLPYPKFANKLSTDIQSGNQNGRLA